ncbi:MAG: 3-hydroxyacyl-CoA dehydrogenase [Algoriphagus sp.]|jgi:3-hydroxyacyl-CoA dehydrogenase
MNRKINKVAVLGAGIMGSRIALHFANIGCEVLVLDMVPREPNDAEKAKGLDTSSPHVRNRIVKDLFTAAVKGKPTSTYSKDVVNRVSLGNFDDDMVKIKDVDWIIEVVVERLDIKKIIYEKVEAHRKLGTLVTSNTSGIPIHLMSEGRSEDFQKSFCGSHFFNPPRYLRLLEIIPGPKTDPKIIDFLLHYGDLYLGKQTVLCKDTPGFIANRLGIYAMVQTIRTAVEMDLTVEQVDKLTGPVVGRPKSGSFRLSDVVGLDTTVNVCNNLASHKTDESVAAFELPPIMASLMEKKWLGDKTGQGFYKKTKDEKGKTVILALDFETMEYRPTEKVRFDTLGATKNVDSLAERFGVLLAGKDQAGEFYRKTLTDGFRYATFRIPEIADELFRVDDAVKTGFGWQMGLFETADAVGVKKFVEIAEAEGNKPSPWVYDMLSEGNDSFYKIENGKRLYYDIPSKSYVVIPGTESFIILDNIRKTNVIWKNAGSTIFDLGDGIAGLEFHSKMNTFGVEVVEGLTKSYDLAEKDFRGLVIGNDSNEAFSAGANLAMLFMHAIEQDFDEINMMIAGFQQSMMRARYSSIPVVTAAHTLTLGGGCELNLHADKIVAAAETYMGLVEVGVGLIPGGGGTKEMALRASDIYNPGDSELNVIQAAFMNIAQAKVSGSAYEAMEMHYLKKGRDQIVLNRSRLLAEAKQAAVELAENGYTMPTKRMDVKVQGKAGIALFKAGIKSMRLGNYISDHDALIVDKLGYVISGGDLSYAQNVSEDYLLDLEREAFLSLCGEQKTLERMQGLLTTGRPPRN